MLLPLVKKLSNQARRLFLIDGLGALLSAFLLGVVLVHWQDWFGIPVNTLYFLALWPCLFAGYDGYCYFQEEENRHRYLRGIATANGLYCLLSIGLAVTHHEVVTLLGWGYIVVEVVIVLLLARIEWLVAQQIAPGVSPQY